MQLEDVKQLLGLPFRPYLSGAPAPPNDEERVAWGKHLGIYDAPPDPEVSSVTGVCIALRTAISGRMTVKHARARSVVSCPAPEALPVTRRAVGFASWLGVCADGAALCGAGREDHPADGQGIPHGVLHAQPLRRSAGLDPERTRLCTRRFRMAMVRKSWLRVTALRCGQQAFC